MRTVLVALMIVAFAVAFSGIAKAEDVKVVGTVEVAKEADAVKTVSIKVDDKTTVAVALDDNGKKLAELAGKKVEATGAKDDKGVLTVKEFKAVE